MEINNLSQEQIVKNSFWKFCETVGVQFIQLVVTVVLARLLGPKDYGTMALVLVSINFLGLFVNSSISSYLVYIKDIKKQDFLTALIVNLIVSFFLFLLLLLAASRIAEFYSVPELAIMTKVMAIVIPFNSISAIYNAYAQKLSLFKTLFIRNTIALPISGVLALLAAYFGFGVWALVIQQISYSFLLCIIVVLSIKITIEGEWKINRSMIAPMTSYGLQNLFSSVIAFVSDNIADLMIGKKINAHQLGFYNRGNAFPSTIANVINNVMSGVLFPAFASYQSDIRVLKEKVRKAVRLSYYVSIPLLFGLIACAKPLVYSLLSEKWAGAIPIIQIICIFYCATPFLQVCSQAILAVGKLKYRIWGETLKFVSTILLLCLLIDYGIKAVAMSRVIVNVVLILFSVVINQIVMGYSLREFLIDILKPVFCGLIMLSFIYPMVFLKMSDSIILIVQVLLGALLYLLVLKLFKVSELNDIIQIVLKKIKRK